MDGPTIHALYTYMYRFMVTEPTIFRLRFQPIVSHESLQGRATASVTSTELSGAPSRRLFPSHSFMTRRSPLSRRTSSDAQLSAILPLKPSPGRSSIQDHGCLGTSVACDTAEPHDPACGSALHAVTLNFCTRGASRRESITLYLSSHDQPSNRPDAATHSSGRAELSGRASKP